MKKIAVIGGAGFLGSHLCERLLAAGNEVVCVDNLLTGKEENIKAFYANPSFTFIMHDIEEALDVKVEEIYNLACPASPVHYQADPIRTTRISVLGAINVLELARRRKCKVLQASTSEVYGDPLEHPQSESYRGSVNPIGIRSCYDEGKRCAESLFFDYFRTHEVRIKVVRIFNTYGPRMHHDDGRVISNFITQAIRRESLTVYGDGSQTRSFCYCDDLIDGLVSMMSSPEEVTGPINLGNPCECTILDLARRINSLTGNNAGIKWSDLPLDDPKQRKPDISLARRILGWEPRIDLTNGLRKTVSHFNDALNA